VVITDPEFIFCFGVLVFDYGLSFSVSMILGFYKQINGRPTNFREKILSCAREVVHYADVETATRDQ
jgi:hypothetical protein